jgi:hypothetical protein
MKLGLLDPVESKGSRGRNAVYQRVLVLDDLGRLEILLLSNSEITSARERAEKHFDLAGKPGACGHLQAWSVRTARWFGGLLRSALKKLRR